MPVDWDGRLTVHGVADEVLPDGTMERVRFHLQLDHIIPRLRGGALDDPDNLETLCNECNCFKGDRLHAEMLPEAIG